MVELGIGVRQGPRGWFHKLGGLFAGRPDNKNPNILGSIPGSLISRTSLFPSAVGPQIHWTLRTAKGTLFEGAKYPKMPPLWLIPRIGCPFRGCRCSRSPTICLYYQSHREDPTVDPPTNSGI